jgi:hypothetical protein
MLPRNIILEQLFSTPAGTDFDLRNTAFFNILRANPSLAIFYEDFCKILEANPSLLKDLAPKSALFFNPDQFTQTTNETEAPKGSTTMAVNPKIHICTYIKVNGIRCGSPALRHEAFCYFHQRMIRGVRTPPQSRLHPIAMLEDEESIQASLMEIINALVRNQIDVPRARVIMRALHIAVKNSPKVSFDFWKHQMVSEIPEYPAAPPTKGPFTTVFNQASALARINVPQPEEPEHERLLPAFEPPKLPPRKPPASVKRLRAYSANRAG